MVKVELIYIFSWIFKIMNENATVHCTVADIYQIGPKWAGVTPLIIKNQFGIIQNLHMSPITYSDQFFGWDFFCCFLQQYWNFAGSNFAF